VISGIFVLTSLLIFEMAVVFGALRSIGNRLDRIEGGVERAFSTRQVAKAIGDANAPDGAQHFEWLRQPGDRFTVFVPLLIGAGAVLSGVAYVVERIAGLFASATLDRKTARLLSPDLPLGSGALAPAGPAPNNHHGSAPKISRMLGWFVSVSIVSLATVAAINALAEATESRPESVDAAHATLIDMQIEQKRTPRSEGAIAEALWTACRNTVPPDVGLVETLEVEGGVRLVVDRGLGELRRRRLFGCLEDATLDLVQASVTSYQVQLKP
jgi:hypothetical protein